MATLRSAGLSQRKAEYVQDLAGRFVDGRLSPKKLIDMSDDDVMKALVEVRGIGRWTVEMFMMFTLRRPDVLPVGDLGVQKGLVKWLTEVNPGIQGKKLPDANEKDAGPSPQGQAAPATPDLGRQATPPPAAANGYSSSSTAPETPLPLSTPGPPSTPLGNPHAADLPLMTPRTEAIAQLPPFPPSDTLPTRQALQARLKKKAKGNVYLTPPEMELLSRSRRVLSVTIRGRD
jgi:DNA-3-methyladenine glycosylase II